jgi:hypothetical protein
MPKEARKECEARRQRRRRRFGFGGSGGRKRPRGSVHERSIARRKLKRSGPINEPSLDMIIERQFNVATVGFFVASLGSLLTALFLAIAFSITRVPSVGYICLAVLTAGLAALYASLDRAEYELESV